MISEDGKLKALNVVAKVLNCKKDGQEFTIKSTVFPLSLGKLLGEEGHWTPDTIEKLLQLPANCRVRSIHRDAGLGVGVGVMEEGGGRQSGLGGEESCLTL